MPSRCERSSAGGRRNVKRMKVAAIDVTLTAPKIQNSAPTESQGARRSHAQRPASGVTSVPDGTAYEWHTDPPLAISRAALSFVCPTRYNPK